MKQQEFITLIKPFKDKLYRLAKRMLISNEEAEDATQEVLLKLWKADTNTFKSMEAMAMTMTKNYCLDQLKAKRSNNLSITHNNYSDNSSLENQIISKDNLYNVEKIINSLPEQQRLIIQLREIEEYEFAEIAKVLDMNETAIRVSLSRARKIIKEKFAEINNYGNK
ncbi:sigma-70 family RNA polymerase sigma factor [uncultured Flavobacterium sp.]|uniref:RNA polymerase sigma factor n=1 Tax=uncultured Flavobacterium sp. TaxID=165435 RepID=UPI0030EBE70F|tara:strand:- start:1021 stop:1521 length:501 start_codon:yes stop_codon:yes gene_type:complete